jgi:hypothetical protein
MRRKLNSLIYNLLQISRIDKNYLYTHIKVQSLQGDPNGTDTLEYIRIGNL